MTRKEVYIAEADVETYQEADANAKAHGVSFSTLVANLLARWNEECRRATRDRSRLRHAAATLRHKTTKA